MLMNTNEKIDTQSEAVIEGLQASEQYCVSIQVMNLTTSISACAVCSSLGSVVQICKTLGVVLHLESYHDSRSKFS